MGCYNIYSAGEKEKEKERRIITTIITALTLCVSGKRSTEREGNQVDKNGMINQEANKLRNDTE